MGTSHHRLILIDMKKLLGIGYLQNGAGEPSLAVNIYGAGIYLFSLGLGIALVISV